MKNYIVYCHTNKVSGKKYVGQTYQGIVERWHQHQKDKSCFVFHNAIKSYGDGEDIWEHQVLEENLTKEEASLREIHWIATLNTNMKKGGHGYNMTDGGEDPPSHKGIPKSEEHKQKMRNRKISDETRKKISDSHMGEKNPNFGKITSLKTRELLSKATKGIPKSEETKQKMSQAAMGNTNGAGSIRTQEFKDNLREKRIGENNPFFGKKHSDETLKVISEKISGENSVNAKFKNEDVVLIRKNFSEGMKIKDIAKQYNVSISTIERIVARKTYKNV